MNFQEILFSAIGVVVTGITGTVANWLIRLIREKISDTRAAGLLERAVEAVGDAVKATYQTYVEALKGRDAFSEAEQRRALEIAVGGARAAMSERVKNFVAEAYGDVDVWIRTRIEATLYELKKAA